MRVIPLSDSYTPHMPRLLLLLIAFLPGIPLASTIPQPLPAEIPARCKQQTGAIRPCYYAHEIDKTILAPPFVLFLHQGWPRLAEYTGDTFDPDAGLAARQMRTLVERWRLTDTRLSAQLEYNEVHFGKIARLCPPYTGKVQQNDLDLLHRWLQRNGNLPDAREPGAVLDDAEMQRLAPAASAALLGLLQTVAGDPLGRRLLRTALARGVVIRAQALQDIQAFYNPADRLLVLDHSVLRSEWKIHVLVHELVHSVNEQPENSLVEEAVAQIIGSGVQDRITGIPMACHPYYVFADRLLRYDGLQSINNISACLEKAGIDCPQDAPPLCR